MIINIIINTIIIIGVTGIGALSLAGLDVPSTLTLIGTTSVIGHVCMR